MSSDPQLGSVDLIEGGAPAGLAPQGVTRLARIGGSLKQSTDGAAYSDIGGGSGTVVADGVTIDGDGSGGDPLAGIPSSASNAGTMSAANFSRVAGLAIFGDWFTSMAAFIASKTSVTEAAPIWPGQQPTGATAAPGVTPDPGVIGGGLSVGGASTRVLTSSIYQSLTAEFWGFGFRAKFALPTSGHTAYAGIQSLAGPGNHAIVVGTIFANDATHYVLKLFGSSTIAVATSVVADTNLHDFAITSDKTTVTLWIDGVSAAMVTGANFTNGVAGGEPNQLLVFNSDAGEAILTKGIYAYVAP
jgi:hypothetical protein